MNREEKSAPDVCQFSTFSHPEFVFSDREPSAVIALKISNIIFDWSGTLVDDLPPVLEATNAVLAHAGRSALSREAFRRSFRLPYTKFYEEFTPHVPMAELEAVFRAAFDASTAPVTLLPHAREFMEFAAERAVRQFVLSSAPQDAVVAQARRFGVDHFIERFHAGIPDKSEVIHDMLNHHEIEAAETIYIGDMVHDIETARKAGIFSVAVLTGYDFAEVLAAADPHLTVADLHHLREWFKDRWTAP